MAWNAGGSGAACQNVALVDPPVASFGFTVSGQNADFTDSSTNVPTSWQWDLGDASSASDQNHSHVYSADGVYTVCLTATNDGGSDTACTGVITAGAAPIFSDGFDSGGWGNWFQPAQ